MYIQDKVYYFSLVDIFNYTYVNCSIYFLLFHRFSLRRNSRTQMSELRSVSDRLRSAARIQALDVAPRTLQSYQTTRGNFIKFCRVQLKRRPKYSETYVLLFLEQLHQDGKSPSTLRSIFSALTYFAKPKNLDLASSNRIHSFLTGAERINPTNDTRKPITLDHLQKITLHLQGNSRNIPHGIVINPEEPATRHLWSTFVVIEGTVIVL